MNYNLIPFFLIPLLLPVIVLIFFGTAYALHRFIVNKKYTKTRRKPWHEMPDDLKFIAANHPGKILSTEDQLKMDRILYGIAIWQIGPNGEKIRLDPTKVIIESDNKLIINK